MANPQVYGRISNPYMPNGTAAASNFPTLYAPGELGCAFVDPNSGRTYLRVQCDSGATASTPTGAVSVGQVAFWKDQSAGIVTNDKRFCDVGASGAINRPAGIFGVAATAGYYVDLIIRGSAVTVAANTSTQGCAAIVDTTASTARVIAAASVTTAPVSVPIGIMTTSTVTNSTAPVDVALGFVGS